MSSIVMDRAQMHANGQYGQMASDPSRGQVRQITHDHMDGKTHILYIMHNTDGSVETNCHEANNIARLLSTVVIQDAMKMQQRPEWLTTVPTLVAIRDGRGNRGNDSVKELWEMHTKQNSMKTVGIAKPLERDANGFPSFAGFGSSMTNSAMLTVGSVVGINQDPSRYQDGKMKGQDMNQALQVMMERRQQQRPFTNRAF